MEQRSDEKRRPVRIAIIDSGIDSKVHDLDRYVKTATGFRVNEEGYIIEDSYKPVVHEHGTAIALIIKHICSNVEFISVNILNENLGADGRVLIYAMEQTLRFKPDIIHMSLGTTKWRHILPMKNIVKKARKEKIILVSAANNEGLRSYPAYLDGVVGVKSLRAGKFEDTHFYGGFFYAPPHTCGIPGIEELESRNQGGTSMAAAYITGAIARVKYESDLSGTEEIKKRFYKPR